VSLSLLHLAIANNLLPAIVNSRRLQRKSIQQKRSLEMRKRKSIPQKRSLQMRKLNSIPQKRFLQIRKLNSIP